MSAEDLTRLIAESLYLVLYVSAPVLAAALLVGLVVSMLSAVTQAHDHSLAFVPKLVAVSAVLALAGGWMATELLQFTEQLWRELPALVP